jgi:broad specificity phosphatase PhoE
MSSLFLVRHANTFEPGEVAHWVGAKQDPPLSASGRAQLPDLLHRITPRFAGVTPVVISSPLRRARETAEAIGGGEAITIDQRLIELDFGAWSGLTDAQIVAGGMGDDLRDWRTTSRVPPIWGFDEDAKLSELRALLNDCKSRPLTVVVTSNGVLKLLGRLLGGPGAWSVKTAHICALTLNTEEKWSVLNWSEELSA